MEGPARKLGEHPLDAVAEMRKGEADWTRIESRVVSLDIKVGGKETAKGS